MDTIRVVVTLATAIAAGASLLLIGGREVAAQSNAQTADRFVEAMSRYVATVPQGTPRPPEGVVFRSLTPLVPDVAQSRRRLMNADAVQRADRAFVAAAAAADATPMPSDPLKRILSDSRLASIEVVSGDLEAMASSQLGDAQVRLCDENRPYCRPIRSSGWTQETEGVRRMQVDLAPNANGVARGTGLFFDERGSVFGTLRIGLTTFHVRQLGQDVFAITTSTDSNLDRYKNDVGDSKPDESADTPEESVDTPDGAGGGRPNLDNSSAADDQPNNVCANPANTQQVDVVVGVTPTAARLAFEKGYDVNHLVRFAELMSNVSFESSDINGRIRVSSIVRTAYDESGGFPAHIRELLKPGGRLTDLRNARRTGRADVAVLVAENPDPRNCGLASGIRVGKGDAYVAVNWRCLSDRFSFIHEIGHLAGAWHDPRTVGSNADVKPPYAYGFVTTGPQPLATIMAYVDSCPVPCGRMWFWSNPYKRTEDGQVLGTIERNYDACVWRQRLPALAAFDGG